MPPESFAAGLDRWRAWQKRSVNRGVFGVILTVAGVTVLVRLVSLVREAIVARTFGTSDALDAYLIAFVLPQFAMNLIGGSLNVALIPTYIHVKEEMGAAAASRLFASVTALSLVLLVAISIVLAAATPFVMPLLASGFSPAKLALAESLFRLLLPAVILTGLTTTWGAILNANNRFALAAVTPAATALLTIALVVTRASTWGVKALVAATVGGAVIEAAIVGVGLVRGGLSIVPRWHGLSDDVRHVIAQYLPVLAGAFLMGSASVVSQSMAATLGAGSVSTLAYGNRLTALILGILATAVSTAVLPSFSRMVAAGEWDALGHTLRTYVRLLLALTVPLTAALVVFSRPLVALLFQRGAFTAADTQAVAWTQAMYLLQVPIYVVGMLVVRLMSALRANRVLMWGSAFNLVVTVALTYGLMKWLGVIGIALATSLMYVGSVAFLSIAGVRLLRRARSTGVPPAVGVDAGETPVFGYGDDYTGPR